jgi:hypothetical protein
MSGGSDFTLAGAHLSWLKWAEAEGVETNDRSRPSSRVAPQLEMEKAFVR